MAVIWAEDFNIAKSVRWRRIVTTSTTYDDLQTRNFPCAEIQISFKFNFDPGKL